MSKLEARLLGKREGGGNRPVAMKFINYRAGALQVAGIYPAVTSYTVTVGNATWAVVVSGPSASPVLVRRFEIVNPTAGALTFRMAIMTVSGGSPSVSNAFYAWDRTIAANTVESWAGELPLVGRYLYARGSGAGLVFLASYGSLAL